LLSSVRFSRIQAEAAQEFIARRHLENVEVCPGRMASTAEEVAVVAPCLTSRHAHRVLIVTSAYHTRRALALFRHRLPQYEWSVAAPDESAYGTDWWRRRAWAKAWLGDGEISADVGLVGCGPVRFSGPMRDNVGIEPVHAHLTAPHLAIEHTLDFHRSSTSLWLTAVRPRTGSASPIVGDPQVGFARYLEDIQ